MNKPLSERQIDTLWNKAQLATHDYRDGKCRPAALRVAFVRLIEEGQALHAASTSLGEEAMREAVNDIREAAYNLGAGGEIGERNRIIEARRRIFEIYRARPAQQVDAPILPFGIMPDEMKALERFHECATDGQDYDVPKEMMRRLAEIGLLRRVTANYYAHTTFGLSVLNGEFVAQQ